MSRRRKPNPDPRRQAQVLFGGTIAIGIALVIWGVVQLLVYEPSRRWPTVTGLILQSEYRRSGLDDRQSCFALIWVGKQHIESASVAYRYEVSGIKYISRQISLWSRDLCGGSGQPRDFVQEHPAGTVVTVYYEPGRPENAVLIPGADRVLDRGLIVGGIAMAILGGLGLWNQLRLIARGTVVAPQVVEP